MSSALATAQSSLGVPVSVPQQGGNSGQQFVSYNGDTYLIQTGKVLQLVGWTYHIHSCQHEHVTQNLLLELIKKNLYTGYVLNLQKFSGHFQHFPYGRNFQILTNISEVIQSCAKEYRKFCFQT